MNFTVGFVKPGSKKICGYREYRIEHDAARYAAMVQKAVDFWEQHVVPKIPPEITEADAETVRYYKNRYPQHTPDKWAYSDESIDSLAAEYLQLTADNKLREERAETMKLKLIAAIGKNEGLKTASGNFTYKTPKPTEKTDWKAVANALDPHLELIEYHTTKQAGSRRFLPPKGAKQ